MDGLQGFSAETTPVEFREARLGMKGVNLEFERRQYLEPKSGLKGFSVEFDIGGQACKIWHYTQ